MKKNFLEVGSSKNSVKQHDYIIYSTHEEKLMSRYEKNKGLVMNEVRKLLDKCNLTGQWSIDIMQNGDDFWLIDMARATESALVECVPKSKLKNVRKPFLGLEEVGLNKLNKKIEDLKLAYKITTALIILGILFYSPFLFYGFLYGVSKDNFLLFIISMCGYTLLFAPIMMVAGVNYLSKK